MINELHENTINHLQYVFLYLQFSNEYFEKGAINNVCMTLTIKSNYISLSISIQINARKVTTTAWGLYTNDSLNKLYIQLAYSTHAKTLTFNTTIWTISHLPNTKIPELTHGCYVSFCFVLVSEFRSCKQTNVCTIFIF